MSLFDFCLKKRKKQQRRTMCTSKYSLQMLRSQRWLPFFSLKCRGLKGTMLLNCICLHEANVSEKNKWRKYISTSLKSYLFYISLICKKKATIHYSRSQANDFLKKKKRDISIRFFCSKYVYSMSSSSPFVVPKKMFNQPKKKTRLSFHHVVTQQSQPDR